MKKLRKRLLAKQFKFRYKVEKMPFNHYLHILYIGKTDQGYISKDKSISDGYFKEILNQSIEFINTIED